nr:MAG TPA: Protein of unknown function (DUF3102) [Caudoviricetes sp.]
MIEIIPTGTFDEWQQALDTEFSKSAESFIRIGYLLKIARDTDILMDTPYANVIDYAKTRYGLDKTQVSRFIAINERFGSKEDDSTLGDKYKGFGYAKLALMLNMPDEIIEEISPDYSKSEIEDIKKEIDEEKKISDIEILIEGKEECIKKLNELEQVLHQLFHDNPELFMKIHTSTYETAELIDIFAPAGEMIYSVRLLGVGRLMLSIKADSGRITITNVRNMEKTEWNIEELAESVINIFSMAVDTEDPAKAWTSIYKEEYPKKAEVAPVQQEKPVQRKEKKVQKAKIEKPKPQPVEEQIPGQDNVLNHPEYLPENGNNKADSTENVQKTDTFVDKQQEKPPYFEKVSAEKEKTEPEMPTNAINTECENEVDALGNYMDCWEAICDAHRKIALFIEDYSTSDITPDNMRIEAARINAVTLAEELEHLKAL